MGRDVVDDLAEAIPGGLRDVIVSEIGRLARQRGTITSDDLPDDLRAAAQLRPGEIGLVFRWAARLGLVVSTGRWVPSTRPTAHGRPVQQWRPAS